MPVAVVAGAPGAYEKMQIGRQERVDLVRTGSL